MGNRRCCGHMKMRNNLPHEGRSCITVHKARKLSKDDLGMILELEELFLTRVTLEMVHRYMSWDQKSNTLNLSLVMSSPEC